MQTRPPIPPGQRPVPRYRRRRVRHPTMVTVRTLRTLSRAALRGKDDIDTALTEAATGSDRGACIIMTSIVQRHLEQIILLRLMIIGAHKILPLFERDGALSSFYGIIHLAFALDMMTAIVRDDLETVRRIRNAFAHSALPITFQSQEIKTELTKLHHRSYVVSQVSDDIINDDELALCSLERKEFILGCVKIMNVLTDAASLFIDRQQELISAWMDSRRAS
jgi:hypothetical protein